MADVVLDRVVKRFGETEVVAGIDLTVRDREFCILVGPSGCGKTTTLRMIAGLEEVTAGDIRIGGEIVTYKPPRERDIAMVFQSYALYPHMTVRKNLSFALELRGLPKKEIAKRIDEVAGIIGLTPLLDRKPRQLSGGQRQRVAVGAALCRQSGVLLFDEPLSNLDAKLRVHMRTELKRLHQQVKSTMVYVTHDQVEAMTMGDRIVIMNGGRIIQVGSAMEVYDRPATRFVAGFIGTPPMNFFDGEVTQAGITLPGGLVMPVPRAGLSALSGRKVVFGMRPEHIALRANGKEHAAKVPSTIEVVEPLGHRTILTASTPAGVLQLEAEAMPGLKPGDRTDLYFDLSRAHLFDQADECAL
ncbi:MAG TPA: ABC transporter ATP-binding protein [Myxococcales bacterium]